MSERKLVRVEKIDALLPIEGADRIEIAMIVGWQVVVQKGLHKVGDKVAYCEVDSLLPTATPAFASLTSLSSKLLHEIDGVGYARIKTIKLKGQISQGYVVPLRDLDITEDADVGNDLTNILGVKKFEKSEERAMNNAGTKSGTQGPGTRSFPDFIPKTDQNRVQNIVPRYNQAVESGEVFEKTFKLDGSSMTALIKDGEVMVCSRNVGFQAEDKQLSLLDSIRNWWNHRPQSKGFFSKEGWSRVKPAANNAFVQMAKNAGLIGMLREFNEHTGRQIAIQGEMVGPSIQKNFEGVKSNEFYVFDIYDIDNEKYLLPEERRAIVDEYGLKHTPIVGYFVLPKDYKDAILDADGPSGLNGKYREGYVYKSCTRDFSFKVISNRYLLKEE